VTAVHDTSAARDARLERQHDGMRCVEAQAPFIEVDRRPG
jgi:hypothetical protein